MTNKVDEKNCTTLTPLAAPHFTSKKLVSSSSKYLKVGRVSAHDLSLQVIRHVSEDSLEGDQIYDNRGAGFDFWPWWNQATYRWKQDVVIVLVISLLSTVGNLLIWWIQVGVIFAIVIRNNSCNNDSEEKFKFGSWQGWPFSLSQQDQADCIDIIKELQIIISL